MQDMTEIRKVKLLMKKEFKGYITPSLRVDSSAPASEYTQLTTNNHLYVGTYFDSSYDTTSYVYELNPSTLAITRTMILPNEIAVADLKVDRTNGFLYVTTRSWSGFMTTYKSHLYKIDLVTWHIDEKVELSGFYCVNRGLHLDVVSGVGYVFSYGSPISAKKFQLSDLTVIGTKTLGNSVSSIGTGIDVVNGYLYYALTSAGLGRLKLSDFNTTSSITLSSNGLLGAGSASSIVVDSSNTYLYCGADCGVVYKIDLATFTEASKVTLTYGGIQSFYTWNLAYSVDHDMLYAINWNGYETYVITPSTMTFSVPFRMEISSDDIGANVVTSLPILFGETLYWAVASCSETTKNYIKAIYPSTASLNVSTLLPKLTGGAMIDYY
jgi:hypothetical protein